MHPTKANEPVDLRRLAALVAVVDHGSFTAAARATHTVQSNISSHIAQLETELDAVLIDRSNGTATAEGELVVARARAVLRELAAVDADLAAVKGTARGRTTIGIIGTTARWLAPLVFDELAAAAPEVQIVIGDGSSRTLLDRLDAQELDLAVIGLPADDTGAVITPLFSEDYTLVVPHNHPLSDHESPLSAAMVAAHPILVPPKRTPVRRQIDAWFAQHAVAPIVQAEIDGLRLLTSLCFVGYGPSIVPATAVPGWVQGQWTIRQLDGIGRRHVGLAQRRRGQPTVATKAAAAAIAAVVSRYGPEVTGVLLTGSEQT